MRILDRYILKPVLTLFLACVFIFLFLYIIVDVFTNLEQILDQKTGLSLLIRYYLAYLPIIFVQVSPFSCLLATLYPFAKFNQNNEIIALRSAGLSIFQITKTVLIFGAIISLIVFVVNDRLVPPALTLTQEFRMQMDKSGGPKAKQPQIINNLSIYGMRNRLFFVNKFSPQQNTMEGIIILEQDEHQNITKKIVANKAAYNNGIWTFYQNISYEFDKNGQIRTEPTYYEEEIIPIPETPYDFLTQRQNPTCMKISQLEDYIWRLSKSGAVTVVRNLKVDLYKRFAEPLTSLVIILLGIPFSLKIKKRATGLSSLGISLMAGFLYYVLNAVSIALGKSGIFTPVLAAYFSHIVIFTLSIYLIKNLP